MSFSTSMRPKGDRISSSERGEPEMMVIKGGSLKMGSRRNETTPMRVSSDLPRGQTSGAVEHQPRSERPSVMRVYERIEYNGNSEGTKRKGEVLERIGESSDRLSRATDRPRTGGAKVARHDGHAHSGSKSGSKVS